MLLQFKCISVLQLLPKFGFNGNNHRPRHRICYYLCFPAGYTSFYVEIIKIINSSMPKQFTKDLYIF